MGFIKKVEFVDGRLVVYVNKQKDREMTHEITQGVKGLALEDTDPKATSSEPPPSS